MMLRLVRAGRQANKPRKTVIFHASLMSCLLRTVTDTPESEGPINACRAMEQST
jgi:hypothetical protein